MHENDTTQYVIPENTSTLDSTCLTERRSRTTRDVPSAYQGPRSDLTYINTVSSTRALVIGH